MNSFLNAAGKLFRGLFKIIESIFLGLVSIISEYSRFSAGVALATGFMYCLKNVPGFGDMAAQIIAIILILAAFGLFKKKKKKS